MIKLKEILNEITNALPPPPIVQQSTNNTQQFSPDFIKYIKIVENGRGVGFDKKKNLWFPYNDSAGPNIGYGHRINNNQLKYYATNGVDQSKVDQLLINDLAIAKKRVYDYIQKTYKVNLLLTPKQEEMLTDFSYNLGGLEKFPKFTDAVLRNQWDIVKKEYIRKAAGKELTGRNKAFYNRYLSKP